MTLIARSDDVATGDARHRVGDRLKHCRRVRLHRDVLAAPHVTWHRRNADLYARWRRLSEGHRSCSN